MSTITDGITVITPELVLGYSHGRDSGNILHEIIGYSNTDVASLEPASLRRGTLTYLFSSKADAFAADTMHAAGLVITLADLDVTEAGMTYVLDGRLELEQDDDRVVWLLTVPYAEVDI